MARIQTLMQSIAHLLRPLIRLLIRHGVSADALNELVRKLYVDVASQEFRIAGKRQTFARISVITGLHRKEVSRLAKTTLADELGSIDEANRAAQVLTAWVRDAAFHDAQGNPLALPFAGPHPSFSSLAETHSGDMKPRSIANELIRVGAIKEEGDKLRLTARGYVPAADPERLLEIMGRDTAELIETIDHNLRAQPHERLFQRKVLYDNIALEDVEAFKAYSAERAQTLLEDLDRWLSRRDRGNCKTGQSVTLGVGAFQVVRTNQDRHFGEFFDNKDRSKKFGENKDEPS